MGDGRRASFGFIDGRAMRRFAKRAFVALRLAALAPRLRGLAYRSINRGWLFLVTLPPSSGRLQWVYSDGLMADQEILEGRSRINLPRILNDETKVIPNLLSK